MFAALALLGLVLPMLIRWHIERSTAAHRYALDEAPSRPVAIVLGAKIWGDRPSHMLEDRLRTALALYESGRCEKILLSGAHDRDDYDEVGVMRSWLESRGVAPDDLYLDHAGLRTFDSMVRARQIFGVEQAIVISQAFHVPRAVYIGRRVGLEVIGVAAPPGYRYSRALQRKNATRERLAGVRAWLDLNVLGTRPKFAGEPVDLDAPGRATH